MKVKIVSDGTRKGTYVRNAETGEMLEGVLEVTWFASGVLDEAYTWVKLDGVELDVVGEIYE